jgi:hypothetical protein
MRLNANIGKSRSFIDCLIGHRHSEAAADERESSPFLVEFFMVEGIGFRCMAYRDFDGHWRGAFNNKALPGMVRVLDVKPRRFCRLCKNESSKVPKTVKKEVTRPLGGRFSPSG